VAEGGRKRIDPLRDKSGRQEQNRELLAPPNVSKIFLALIIPLQQRKKRLLLSQKARLDKLLLQSDFARIKKQLLPEYR
jgi:hypothetical protein